MDLQLEALTRGLEHHFRQVERTRMAELPILNARLHVQAVGFRRTDEGCLGVLITPWFINLVLLPCEGDDWQDLTTGSRTTRVFASGVYEFLIADEPSIGRYQVCSLLSPVFELADQEAALVFADTALQLLDEPEQGDRDTRTVPTDFQSKWKTGEYSISRRDLLRGRFAERSSKGPAE